MKKRRTLIISLLLVAALALGIGYAALSTELTVTGSVTNQPHPINVVYTGENTGLIAVDGDNDDAYAASNVICTADAKSATFNVAKLSHNGDFVVAKFEVINKNEYKVQMETPTVSYTGDSFYAVTTYWVDGTGAETTAPKLGKNETATFYVKVMMNKTTAESLSGDFTVSIKGTSAE